MTVGPRRATHEIVSARVPAVVMGVRFRTVIEICRVCFAPAKDLSRYTCHGPRKESWESWAARNNVEELTHA